jgi:hypothetical protein
MSLPSNGITAEVIRETMPPYHLSPDLLEATFAALPPPPADATAAWRQARITRWLREISALMPADASQARLAAQILIVREMADAFAARVHAPALTAQEMCRVGRISGELTRAEALLLRALERAQQTPAPFFGTVLADAVDVAAADATWCKRGPGCGGAGAWACGEAVAKAGGVPGETADATPAAGETATGAQATGAQATGAQATGVPVVDGAAPVGGAGAEPPGGSLDAELRVADTDRTAAVMPMASPVNRTTTEERTLPRGPSDAAVPVETDARSTAEGVVTRLDQGPGWTLEVVRPRTGGAAGGGGPGSGPHA